MQPARIDPNAPKDGQKKLGGWKDVGRVRLAGSQLTVFQRPPVQAGPREADGCVHDTVTGHLELASSSTPNTFTRTFVESSLSQTITIICIYLGEGGVHKNTVSSRSLTHF